MKKYQLKTIKFNSLPYHPAGGAMPVETFAFFVIVPLIMIRTFETALSICGSAGYAVNFTFTHAGVAQSAEQWFCKP
jgi:hypothetical protein